MRVGTLAVALLLSAFAVAPVYAQYGTHTDSWLADRRFAGEAGSLLVWRVVATSPPRPFTPASLDPAVKSETSGSFGQTAGNFGQTAGSTGQTASSIGQPSSTVGRTAGSVGWTAGSFGTSLSNLASVAARNNGSAPPDKTDPSWDSLTQKATSNFPFSVTYKDVGIDELESRLKDVAGSTDAPDVLVGTPLPESWFNGDSDFVRRFGLLTIGIIPPLLLEEAPEAVSASSSNIQALILRAAPHPRAARAFVLWNRGWFPCPQCSAIGTAAERPVIALAKAALYDLLSGQGLGGAADKEAAVFNPQLAQQIALNVPAAALAGRLTISIDIWNAEVNARFGVVDLRAVVESSGAFGVVYAVALLRPDNAGKWHVLQITPNLPAFQQDRAFGILSPYAEFAPPDNVVKVLGIAQAAPINGDNREAAPDLWWDNRGGATLEVVEWQRRTSDGWTNPNLFLVPDKSGHLRTRVTAQFADSPGPYLWRIWSVGRGGMVVISPWRSLNIISH